MCLFDNLAILVFTYKCVMCKREKIQWCIIKQTFLLQQGYSQQDYGSYTQPAAAPESTYSQAAPSAGAYAQQPYGSSYGQAAATTAAAAAAAPGLQAELIHYFIFAC